MKTSEQLIYQLVLLTSLHFPSEKVRDIAEDYAEYLNLRETAGEPETPWQFCSAMTPESRWFRPGLRTMLAFLAAALLAAGGIWKGSPVTLSLLTAGLPIAIWTATGGGTAARYSPGHAHAARCVVLPFLFLALPALGFVLTIDAVVTGKTSISPETARLFHMALRGCSAASVLLFLGSGWLLWKRSIWYFCPMVQAVAGWSCFRGIFLILTSMDISLYHLTEHFFCLIPLALGMVVSVVFACLLRKTAGRGYAQWKDR